MGNISNHLPGGFNPANVEDEAPRSGPLPAGQYNLTCLKADVVQTKSGTGQMLVVEWVVADGNHSGRHIWHRINFINSNPKAQDIGQRELKNLTESVGLPILNDSAELQDKFVRAIIKIDPKEYNGEKSNVVKRYLKYGASAPAPEPAPAAAPAPAPAPATAPAEAGNKRPWE